MIRFAAVPKCASRTLLQLGLLGELEGRHHTPVTDYPDWRRYQWHRVTRPAADWYASWWRECRDTGNLLGQAFGMSFEDMNADLAKLQELPLTAPRRPGVNAWVPADFLAEYSGYLERGLGLYEYCIDTITDGVSCIEVPLDQLDAWLTARGYAPLHENEADYALG